MRKAPFPMIADTGRGSRIRKSADMFRKRFVRSCLWRKCKLSRGSFRRNYTPSSSASIS